MIPSRGADLVVEVPGARVHILISRRSDGDFHLDVARAHPGGLAALEARRRRLVDAPWTQPDEVHGRAVAVVERPGEHDLEVADAAVTRVDGAVLGIWTGDCAPVALIGDDGTIGAVHAGWRGAVAGVLEAAVGEMRRLGSRDVSAVLGPCIHACCYEFGDADLAAVAADFGDDVRAVDRAGRPALDMSALVAACLRRCGVTRLDDRSVCTGCRDEDFFSHRARGERERQVMAIWRTSP